MSARTINWERLEDRLRFLFYLNNMFSQLTHIPGMESSYKGVDVSRVQSLLYVVGIGIAHSLRFDADVKRIHMTGEEFRSSLDLSKVITFQFEKIAKQCIETTKAVDMADTVNQHIVSRQCEEILNAGFDELIRDLKKIYL